MVENLSEDKPQSLLERIIHKRGLSLEGLETGIEALPDESLLANIEKGATRIKKAMYDNEPIVIFGHDDPDGITSTYILYQFFNACGFQNHRYFIPNRNLEPYGIQDSLIDFVKKDNYQLVITVDNGIASFEGVEKLREIGCETLITDHHLIQPDKLPNAYTIINPHLSYNKYPYKMLAGAGVVLLLIRYLARELEYNITPDYYFWTAVGSIADRVPMTEVNRIIVRYAFQHWKELNDSTVEFLLPYYSPIETYTDIYNFIQYLTRLLSNGREENGQNAALRFLIDTNEKKEELFRHLELLKNQSEAELYKVYNFLDTLTTGFESNVFIYFDDEDIIPYHLLGAAASYIAEKFSVPTLILRLHNSEIVCEGRCAEGFNLVEAFTACKKQLKQYGGHAKAAGFSLEPDKYDSFLECFHQYLDENSPESVENPQIEPDAVVSLDELNERNWLSLELLLPYGEGNPKPCFLIKDTSLMDLQSKFQVDINGFNFPNHIKGNVLVNWIAPQVLRILSFTEASPFA
ncbi:MAG: DHH family phosphoesterase [Candidatus Cloacimonetes bacterium]|jgi:single-stranded-DNA-specific exonuclease